MPRYDGTGPLGYGPRTGRGLGPCGLGFGGGMGWRRFYSPKNELNALKEEEEVLKEELLALREQIKELSEENK